MKHFNYNQVAPSVFDSGYAIGKYYTPSTTTVGELVTIGRGNKVTAIYMPSDKLTDDQAHEIFSTFPPMLTALFVYQYVKPIGGYLAAYMLD